MFRITEIELQDWCQHRTFKATFDPNTNGIIGPNGSGKSNLISAIYTGLTGHCLLGNIADNIGNGADKAIVTLRFAQNGTTGVVTRAFTVAPLDRTKVTTTAKLQFGDAKTTGVNAVTAELIKITGFNPKVLRTHIFITQGELESLLFSAGTVDKLKSFLTLLPEIEKTEPLRAQLQNEINQFPEVVMGADIGDLEAKLATENTRLTELTGLAKSCVQTLNDLDIDFIRRQRRDAQTRATLAGSLSGLVAMETAAKLKAQQAQQARDKLVANMPPAVSETEGLEVAAIRQAEVKDAADRERVRQYGLVQEGLAALAVRMESLVPPGDPDPAWQDIASLQKHAIELAVQLEQDAKLEKLLASPGGKCPTCDREFEDHANKLAAVRQRLDANTVGLRQTRQLFETLQALKQKHDRLVKDYDDKVVELTSQHGVMMQRLASTPQVSCLTDAQKAKNKAVIERYDTAKLAYERAASTLRSAETLVTETLNNAATVAASVARVSGEIAAIPEIDTNLLDSAEQLYNETNATLQSIGTEQTVRGATVKSLGADIEKARQQRRAAIASCWRRPVKCFTGTTCRARFCRATSRS